MELTRHPLSAAWPDMEPDDFQALRDSIADSGQREPIVLLEGEVLDGWQRYQACRAEGVEPKTEEFAGDDPVEYVRDKHTRRPLSLTQRMTAIALMHQRRPRGVNSRASSANVADDLTAAQLARKAGGGVRTAESVNAALGNASPELVDAMKSGAVPAHRAEQIAKLPHKEQPSAIAAPRPTKTPAPAAASPAPAAAPDAARTAQLEDQVATLLDQLVEAREDIASMAKILDANDKVAEALSEAKKARDLARGYKARIDSMTTQIAELKRSAASWEKKAKAVAA